MTISRIHFPERPPAAWAVLALALAMPLWASGCGTTKAYEATQQLMASDAVDTAIARIDFTPLEGQKVFFDTEYLKNYKGVGFTNAEYVISSLRQQMIAAGVKLQKTAPEADFVIEGRIGVLGADDHEVVYGLPSTNALSAATSAVSTVSGGPTVPGIPELSVARRRDQVAAAKIGVFAYERETGERVWQSGLSVARSTARDLWFCGIGPFQRGTIYDDKLRFAGQKLDVNVDNSRPGHKGPIYAYKEGAVFKDIPVEPVKLPDTIEEKTGEVQPASAEEAEQAK
jgi:hypothetical protein